MKSRILGLLATLGLGWSNSAVAADTFIHYPSALYMPSHFTDLTNTLTGVGASVTVSTSTSWMA